MHIQSRPTVAPHFQDFAGGRHILLVINDHRARYDLADMLLDAGCRLTLAGSFNVADMLLDMECGFDLLVADEALPGFGTAVLARLATIARPGMPVLLLDEGGVCGPGTVETALQMMIRWPV